MARDTNAILSALSTSPSRTPRATRSQFSSITQRARSASSSSLSSAPSTLHEPVLPETRKRKRGKDAPLTTASTVLEPSATSNKENDPPTRKPTPRKGRRQPAKKTKHHDGTVHVAPPANWEEVYNLTAEMRKRVLAPVDTMGCESLAEDHRSPRDKRLQTLIALMMSSQTKDTTTAVAMRNLQNGLPGGFCLASLRAVSPEVLNSLINKVGFHNIKTKNIKRVAEILDSDWGVTSLVRSRA